jgi:DNA-binding transcriptional regulator YiaG
MGIVTPAEARQTLGLSQKEMAQAMNVHYMTWRKWERGERKPDNAAARLMGLLCWLHENRGQTLAQWLKEI